MTIILTTESGSNLTAWDAFYPFVVPEVIGCPIPTVDFALLQAAREFCKRSVSWKLWADARTADGVLQKFAFVLPEKTELVRVTRALVNAKDVKVYSSLSLPSDYRRTGTTYTEDALVQVNSSEYMLYPLPASGSEILLELALQPSIDSTGITDEFLLRHAETISKGALYRLQSSSRKDYSDPQAAMLAKSMFESGIHFAANEAFMQTAPSERRVKKW